MAPAEVERRPIFGRTESVEETVEQPVAIVGGGATRGAILHKLMEEVQNGEIEDGLEALVARDSALIAQLSVAPSDQVSAGISPHELGQYIAEITQLRPRLVPEHTIYAAKRTTTVKSSFPASPTPSYNAEGRIEIIVDWKSDVDIDTERLNSYREQLDAYRRHTGAPHAVLMTPGRVITA